MTLCTELNLFDKKKEYLSEKVAFEKAAIWPGDAMYSPLLSGFEGATSGFGSGLGKGMAEAGIAQIGRLIGGTARSIHARLILNKKREKLIDDIMQNDYVINTFEKENPGSTLKAYSTMVRIAPMLSTDPNIVISFLRNTAQTGGTMDFATVKLLADAESAVNKARNPEGYWQLGKE